jgi:hypothetical protein
MRRATSQRSSESVRALVNKNTGRCRHRSSRGSIRPSVILSVYEPVRIRDSAWPLQCVPGSERSESARGTESVRSMAMHASNRRGSMSALVCESAPGYCQRLTNGVIARACSSCGGASCLCLAGDDPPALSCAILACNAISGRVPRKTCNQRTHMRIKSKRGRSTRHKCRRK